MTISIIVAATLNNIIGNKGATPWYLPDDLRYFKRTTLHHHIIMGRKTFEEFGLHKPLPQRTNIIITHRKEWQPEGCLVVHHIEDALDIARQNGETEAFIVGGEQIYRWAMPYCHRIYLTRIETVLDGDTFFPDIDLTYWREMSRSEHPTDEKHAYSFAFIVYERITKVK